jgi:hypothetical protein
MNVYLFNTIKGIFILIISVSHQSSFYNIHWSCQGSSFKNDIKFIKNIGKTNKIIFSMH